MLLDAPDQTKREAGVPFPIGRITAETGERPLQPSSGVRSYSVCFDGAVLNRGFWLYVCSIAAPNENLIYVGQTGDSSSPYAQSAFNRLSRHLDLRPQAKGNCLTKRLREEKCLEPSACRFEMVAIGPLYPECNSREHDFSRNKIRALERQLSDSLRKRGYEVIGKHPRPGSFDKDKWKQVVTIIDTLFPDVKVANKKKQARPLASCFDP